MKKLIYISLAVSTLVTSCCQQQHVKKVGFGLTTFSRCCAELKAIGEGSISGVCLTDEEASMLTEENNLNIPFRSHLWDTKMFIR
ncbi:MAG TPA: hypothetical protein VF623_05660 [Segetibacter sp.]